MQRQVGWFHREQGSLPVSKISEVELSSTIPPSWIQGINALSKRPSRDEHIVVRCAENEPNFRGRIVYEGIAGGSHVESSPYHSVI